MTRRIIKRQAADQPRRSDLPVSRRQVLKASGATLAVLGISGNMPGFSGRLAPGRPGFGIFPEAKKSESPSKPNIVLVHGAWADGSSWSEVIEALQKEGYPVFAVPVAMTSLSADIASTQQFLDSQSISGPTLLVGHSYGGAVIGGAAYERPDIVGLVYVAAFAPAQGETLLSLLEQYPPTPGLQYLQTDASGNTWINREHFPEVFAQDVDEDQARVMAAVQRPIGAATLVEPAGPTAWDQIPTWYQISEDDRMIHPDAERSMAERMGATTISLDSSHASLVSRAKEVARLIEDAAKVVSG